MSPLVEILDAHRDAILDACHRQLDASDGHALGRTAQHGCQAVLGALRTLIADQDQAPAWAWARTLLDPGGGARLSLGKVLAGLQGLESVCRAQVIRELDKKRPLAAALTDLCDGIDLLRRCAVEVAATPPDQAEAAHQGFAAVVEREDDAVCLADMHGRPFYLNHAARQAFGLSDRQPLADVRLHDLYSEESWAELRDVAVPAVKHSGQWDGRSDLRHAETGQETEFATEMFLVRPQHAERAACLAIVHRRPGETSRLERALAESKARKHAILETSLDPIITIDARGVITEFNHAAEVVFGYPREKVLGTRPSEVLFPAVASAGEQNRIERYLEAGEGSLLGRRVEVSAVRASGETFPAEMAMTISQEEDAPVMTFFVRDISERKRAEEEQARYAAELERSNAELEQFAYVASHDLQEPLRKIRTFGDRLQVKCSEALDDMGRECLARMLDAAERMQGLIHGLLSLSRVTTQGQEFVPVDLAQVAGEVARDLEAQIERVEGRVEVGHLPTIRADPLQMRQLLQNLIANALKFHRPDEPPLVQVSGRFVKGRHERSGARAADEKCQIVVADNGIGFDEKYLDRLFKVFQRLHSRDAYEGAGVGLAICRKIAERHGGTISAQSKPDSGARFLVTLPVFHRAAKDRKD